MRFKALTAVAATTATIGALALLGTGSSNAADVVPSQDACATTNNNTPLGNCGPFTQLWRDNFNGADAAVGKFSNCAGDGDFRCEGLAGTRYYDTVGAYPSGWEDTAKSGNDGNGGRTLGGYYRPENTVSVYTNSSGDGMMRVHMYRPSTGGSNRVAAVVPRKCMNMRYGKFTERLVVRSLTPGFKMAHLRYSPNEVDYPEAGGNFDSDPISWFTHGFYEGGNDVAPNSAWTTGHTYSQEITPGKIKFYFDGKLMNTVNADFPDKTDWVLQNESALAGSYAAAGSSVNIDTTFATCYSYNSTLAKQLNWK